MKFIRANGHATCLRELLPISNEFVAADRCSSAIFSCLLGTILNLQPSSFSSPSLKSPISNLKFAFLLQPRAVLGPLDGPRRLDGRRPGRRRNESRDARATHATENPERMAKIREILERARRDLEDLG